VCNTAEKDGVLNGPEPAYVQGRDIISVTDRKPGPWVGKIVEEAMERQYRGEFTDRDAALEWAREQAAG
jgi:tRNA nucleotidyltransferase/poly(A) polymerase